MASITGIQGISYARYRGGWKLRWRETHETPDGLQVRARSYTAETEADVPGLAVEIRRALDKQGWWEPAATSSPVLARDWWNWKSRDAADPQGQEPPREGPDAVGSDLAASDRGPRGSGKRAADTRGQLLDVDHRQKFPNSR